MNKLIAALMTTCAALSTAHADDCRRSADRTASIDLAGVTKVVLATGAGDLKVQGQAGATTLTANGRACASNDELLEQIQLETRREGSTVYFKTRMPDLSDGNFGFNRSASLDLDVRLPDSIPVDLEDSSGDLELSKVKSAVVADSSGDIDIEDIGGDLTVSDSSGDIEIERVVGNLSVRDSSGDMEIENVQGDVEIPVDSSGDIEIAQVGGVHIRQDSSGGITIRRVVRNVRIDSDSSGGIDVAEVGGDFTVGSDGSGGIKHSRVLGKVEIPPQ